MLSSYVLTLDAGILTKTARPFDSTTYQLYNKPKIMQICQELVEINAFYTSCSLCTLFWTLHYKTFVVFITKPFVSLYYKTFCRPPYKTFCSLHYKTFCTLHYKTFCTLHYKTFCTLHYKTFVVFVRFFWTLHYKTFCTLHHKTFCSLHFVHSCTLFWTPPYKPLQVNLTSPEQKPQHPGFPCGPPPWY